MIEISENNLKSKKQFTVNFFPIEMKKPEYIFLPANYVEVTQAITNKIPLQKLLKLIHENFADQGLTTTLIHRIYESNQNQIAYYVPELVYIAVKKMCRSMRKVLVFKTVASINLRRLILWNIKAFTVLMIQRDEKLKKFIVQFEEQIVRNVKDQNKFKQSEKAISMLTTASLVLKKLPKQEMKDQLKNFIKRYNQEILNNLQHNIVIPFRQDEQEKNINSTYIVRLIEDNCSCFPTRKRVPYRIVLETVDLQQLKQHNQLKSPLIFKKNKEAPLGKERDLYNETKDEVQKNYKLYNEMKIKDNKYPFIVDQQEFANINELNKYAKRIQSQQKQKERDKDKEKEKEKEKEGTRKFNLNRRNTIETYRSLVRSSKFQDGINNLVYNKGRFQIKDNQQLKKFQAIYIPTLASNVRKSDMGGCPKGIWVTVIRSENPKKRYSQRDDETKEKDKEIKEVQEQVKYDGNNNQSVFKQPWSQTLKSLKQTSPFNKLKSLKFRNMVVKGGDDLRQQIICMQLIYKMRSIIKDAEVEAFIKPYQIIVLSQNSGMLQFVSNSISIDGIKKEKQISGLFQFYTDSFYPESRFLNAKLNFIRSLAGSSIITYILKIKDRHNGNILIDIDGNIIHIDFGFILGMSPGGINFESSPFKLTEQYVILMGGKDSPDYLYFVDLFCNGMNAIRKRCSQLCLILQIMMQQSDLECFQGFKIQSFRDKFQENLSDEKFREHCEALVERSCMNSRTVHYDTFQKITNGIMP